jgi:DNA-binding NtrC family response regulator
MKDKENIFITWHYTTHGIAYLKHILSAYYKYGLNEIYKKSEISQEDMNHIFSSKEGSQFTFDKVYYLTTEQKSFDKLSLRRIDYIDNIVDKDDYIKKDKKLNKIWSQIVERRVNKNSKNGKFPTLQDEFDYVRTNHKPSLYKWKETVWRDIHHYRIQDQILWFGKYSNAKEIYKTGETFINTVLDINDFRNAIHISKKIIPFIKDLENKHPNANFIINASLGSNETQVVWQVLSELNILPNNTILIQTYDNKEKKKQRFKPFIINKLPNKIVTEISSQIKIYDKETKSESRRIAELKMKHYIKSGFAILLLGERGIGKTRLAEKISENTNIVSINCASFTNNQIAESILFGHKKGAFTDAKEDRIGAFEEAKSGILFLDEIHHLDKLIQTKLMKALQTNRKNQFTIMPVGGNEKDKKKLMLTIILASNVSISKLREKLLPDFYDRVTQLVIELPPLRDSKDDLPKEFENIWEQLNFDKNIYNEHIKKDKKLVKWIKELDLYGNYRDLQKIAIYYKTHLDFDKEIIDLIQYKKPFEFTKNEFEKYISTSEENPTEVNFPKDKKAEEIIDKYRSQLARWAIQKYHGAPNAAAHFKELGGNTTISTLYKWSKY